MSSNIYCSKCRDANGQNIARQKLSNDVFRTVEVVSELGSGLYECRCGNCGHTWKSKSPEAAELYRSKQSTAANP